MADDPADLDRLAQNITEKTRLIIINSPENPCGSALSRDELETIANGFPGVEQAFAIQAGRELRVLVGSKNTDDANAAKICRDIAKAFEEQLTYPGEIKVTVVRESRFTELAR